MGDRSPRDAATNVFVGRKSELTHLRDGLHRLFDGSGGMFLLSGEPGIGKTRLAEQLAIEARQRHAHVFWGRCTQAEGAPPYWPWVQILRSLLRDLGETEFGRLAGPGLAQILQVVPELRGHFPDVAAISLDDERARFQIYDSVTQLVVDAATRTPIVLVLDDLQWADTPSLLLLQLLAGVLPQSAVMVLGTYRDRELAASHPLRTHLADFVRRGETAQMSIGGLAESEVVSLIRGLTGFQPVADLVRRLQSRTGGNPFFLRELARSLEDEGEEPPRTAPYADAVPEGVAAVLSRRLEALSHDCRRLVEVAAVTGLDLDLDLLEAVTNTRRPRLLDLLDEADAKAMVTRRDGGYAFTHGLVRDTVYGSISRARRAELHGVVGRVVEERRLGEPDVAAAQLAYHFVAAAAVDQSLRAKALQYAAASARRAQAELAYEEAVRLFELALGMIAPVDRAERAELLLSLGRARYLAGDIGGAMTSAQEVARLADELDDRNLLARAALVVRGVGGGGLSEDIRRLCETALGRPPEDASLRIQLLAQQTVALMQMGGMEHERRAIESSQQALQLAQEAEDPDVLFAAIHARQMALSGPAGVEERLQLAERVRDLARETRRPSMAQWGHAWRVDALVQLCRIDEAEVELALQARLADQLREPLLMWRTRVAQCMLATVRGRFDEAERLSDEARLLGRKGHHAAAEFLYAIQSVSRAISVGGLESAIEAMYSQEIVGSTSSMLFWAGAMAIMGRLEDARAALRQVTAAGLETVGPPLAWLPAMAQLTDAVSAVGDKRVAPWLYQALLPYARYNVTTGAGASSASGSVSRYLGMLAATLERFDDAAEYYEEALAAERRMGAPPFVVRTQIAYAEMLVQRGRDADLHRARRLLDAAIVTSRELGMKPWIERAEALAGALTARGVADHPLSSREFEVAALVAEGFSNRAIAERLHVSERTAESHVKNICDKLGFNSRSQVAAWVAGRHPSR